MKSKHCSFTSLVSPYDLKRPIDWNAQFSRSAPTDVEIGFGMGETLMRMAQESPERNFIGVEQHWKRICKTLRVMTKSQSSAPETFKNVRILRVDARVVFQRLFAPRSIDTVYCLFPCPWPKKGHVKHRLFNNGFLRLLNNRLKKSGTIRIVTDFYPYFQWVLAQAQGAGFCAETATVRPQYDTKFERKWRDEGQEEFFKLDLFKKRHIEAPVKKDIVLKSYTLNEFDFDRLQLKDETGKVSVIFKDKVFDRGQQKVMVHAIVAEEHLTQHFWSAIVKNEKTWRIARAEGQNFFPTPGIAKALELVYEAAKSTD
ncbi:MAG: tRNA (guanosine(46)-N7)-methyltransferase TrmB [Candidatus Omnitrophica bacterium]|nr:tRNA (guanosine(46)-N7)-methyltransferase TrmB [Candidatus Omnitrophota bacterium]MCK5259436.1 tRNA (guanosine(46)-N7)-methyltransferase TrmB [Candidatus Omnitrophota bacterium]